MPCISTNCKSGPSEILLNGKGGYLVKIRKPYLLAEKMLLSIDNYNVSLVKMHEQKVNLIDSIFLKIQKNILII